MLHFLLVTFLWLVANSYITPVDEMNLEPFPFAQCIFLILRNGISLFSNLTCVHNLQAKRYFCWQPGNARSREPQTTSSPQTRLIWVGTVNLMLGNSGQYETLFVVLKLTILIQCQHTKQFMPIVSIDLEVAVAIKTPFNL